MSFFFFMCAFSSPLYASIWLKMWPRWVAWLLSLCPTFPLIRLGHKGSTSAIVTAGWAGCVPQTGWSRKIVSLREYSIGEQRLYSLVKQRTPEALYPAPPCAIRTCASTHGYLGKGTPNGTILLGRCFLLPMQYNITSWVLVYSSIYFLHNRA